MKSLKARWSQFLGMILDPWTLMLLIGTAGLWTTYAFQDNKAVAGLLLVLVTLAAAVLGGRVTKHWSEVNESSVLRTRGKSAVGSLQLLLGSLVALEKRVITFLERPEDSDDSDVHKLVTRDYEEIVETCNRLQEEAVHSIENWTDIVPEASIKSQIGVISNLKAEIKEKVTEREELRTQLEAAEDASAQEREEMEERLARRDAELAKLRSQLLDNQLGVGGLLGLGSSMTPSGALALASSAGFADLLAPDEPESSPDQLALHVATGGEIQFGDSDDEP